MRLHSFFLKDLKMTLIFLIDSQKAGNSRYGDETSKVKKTALDFYNLLYGHKESIVQIDVGDFLEKLSEEEFKDLMYYSGELKKNNLSVSPYPSISISFKYNKEGIIFVQEDKNDTVIIFLAFKSNPYGIENILLINIDFNHDNKLMIETRWLCPFIGKNELDSELSETYSKLALQVFLIVCSVIQSKNCELISIPEPKILNEKRIKKGKTADWRDQRDKDKLWR